ncbi:MAG: hypothetical protein KAG66_16765, partial [Methylococcales bacterium]|nr:hypothetical protein [Methylococcales bacterium]
MNTLLQKLSNAVGVSGAEKEVRLLIKDEIADHVDEWRVDSMGNLIALKKGTGALDLRVMVDAHMDEVGMMITEVDAQGTAKFMNVGGMSGDILLGKVVQVGKKKMTGSIGAKPIHLLKTQAERTKTVTASNMRIDIGAASKEAGARKMKVGDCATFLTEYEEWGEVAVGKALDNRCGCVALIHLLRAEPYPFDLYAVFSVQEEIGLRGAPVAARGIDPDVAIILETTPAYDLPNKQDASPNVVLGGGASIYVMDRMAIQSPPLVRHIMKTATEHDIPFQVRQ